MWADGASIEANSPAAYAHSWQGNGQRSTNPLGVEWFGLVMGLGFVLSFGYWCTDFLVVQRAMAADSMTAARRMPLIAAFPRCFSLSRHSAWSDRDFSSRATSELLPGTGGANRVMAE